jgi:uncharacterized protein (DUF433 family)
MATEDGPMTPFDIATSLAEYCENLPSHRHAAAPGATIAGLPAETRAVLTRLKSDDLANVRYPPGWGEMPRRRSSVFRLAMPRGRLVEPPCSSRPWRTWPRPWPTSARMGREDHAMPGTPSGSIEIDPDRCCGRPVLRGTRFPLAQLVADVAVGRSLREVAADYDLDPALAEGAFRELATYLDRPGILADLPGPAAGGSLTGAIAAIRAAGGDGWDKIADVPASLDR